MSNLNVDESSFDELPKKEPEKDSKFDNLDPPLKRESEKNSIFDNLDPPPKGENEKELEDVRMPLGCWMISRKISTPVQEILPNKH